MRTRSRTFQRHQQPGQRRAGVAVVELAVCLPVLTLITLATVDKINGTHRAHHQILAKLLNAAAPDGYDPRRQPISDDMAIMVRRSMAEIMGLTDGFCGGRGGGVGNCPGGLAWALESMQASGSWATVSSTLPSHS